MPTSRTSSKKTPQGFQALASCSKDKKKFVTRAGTPYVVGVVMCHALLWDLSGNAALPKLDENLCDVANTVMRLVYKDKEKARRAKVAAAPPERTHD